MAAKWLHPVLFCNDINIKTLIDITLYDDEHMLITCRSFIKRFNITDRVQVNSWIAKSWHPFSCGAVKLPNTDKIYAVVNQSTLYHWPIEEKDIQNFKKNVFKSHIHTLVSTEDNLFIIYSNGFVEPLQAGQKTRKDIKPQLIGINEIILQCHIFQDRNVAALLVKTKEGIIKLYQVKISSTERLSCSQIEVEGFQLTGSLFLPSGELLSTWSNGDLYSMKMLPESEMSTPGNVKGKLNNLKANKKTKIMRLSDDHIALQGMNINEEGGLLVLFDTKFGLAVNSKPLKMYKDPPLAWAIPSGVVAADGGSLVYVPISLSPSTVGSMLGCRVNEQYFDDVCISWSQFDIEADGESDNFIPLSAIDSLLSNKSTELTSIIRKLNLGTASEDIIVNEVVLSLIATKNIKLLSDCISSVSFLPEKSLVSILKLFLELSDDVFTIHNDTQKSRRKKLSLSVSLEDGTLLTNGISDLVEDTNMDVVDLSGDLEEDKDVKKEAINPFSKSKSVFINEILVQPFSADILREEIKVLDFKNCLTLIQYLHYLLASGEARILDDKNTDIPTVDKLSLWVRNPEIPTIEKTTLWLGLLFDANYQHFVMTSEVDIYKMLMTVFTDITSLLEFWEASHSIDVLVERVQTSNPIPTTQVNSPYSIERLVL